MAGQGTELADTLYTAVLLPLPPQPARRSKVVTEHLQRGHLLGPLLKEILEQKACHGCSHRWSSPLPIHHQKHQILARDPVALLLKTGK
jgi:hypothetical protein